MHAMAIDFFDRQDHARRADRAADGDVRLVAWRSSSWPIYLVLAVAVGMIVAAGQSRDQPVDSWQPATSGSARGRSAPGLWQSGCSSWGRAWGRSW